MGKDKTGIGTLTVSGTNSTYNIEKQDLLPQLLTVGDAGTGTVNLMKSGGLKLYGGKMLLGAQTTGQGTLNIGATPGAASVLAGYLDAESVEFGTGQGTINFNTSNTHTFTQSLVSQLGQGQHQINQIAGETILTGQSQGYKGKTTISGGKLIVRGTLSGDMQVTGGTLQFGDQDAGLYNRISSVSVQGSGSTLAVQGPANIAVEQTVDLGKNTILDLGMAKSGQSIYARRFNIGQDVTLELNNIVNLGENERTLIHTIEGINGDFSTINVVDTSPDKVDYKTVQVAKSADSSRLLASYVLSWNANNTAAHGTFTLGTASDKFTVSTDLKDQPSNSAKQWDGKTLTKAGEGTLTLSGNNSYTGGTELNGGQLHLARDAALGNAAGGLRLNGGKLVATQTFNSSRHVQLAQTAQIEVLADKSLGLDGVLSGSGNLSKLGSGTLALSGDNTFSGGLSLLEGTVSIDRDANLGDGQGGVLFNGGVLATSTSFDSARAAEFRQDAQWNVADQSTLHLSGTLSGTGALLKTGNGTLRLSGQNQYLGGTAIHEGTLEVAQDANLGDASGSIRLHGGTLHATDSFASARQIDLDQQETMTVSSGATLTLTGSIEGTGALHQKGSGTMVLSGDNRYEGGTTLHEGRLVISQDSNLGTGALGFQGGELTSTASFDMSRQITLNQNAFLDVATGTVLGLNGKINGTGHLVKDSTGTLRLSNTANRYGDTQILAGTVIAQADSLSGNVLNRGALVFEQSADGSFQGELSGAGSLLKTGAGVLTLSGNNGRYTGHSTVSEGTLAVLDALGGSASVKNATLQLGDGVSGAASQLLGDLNIEGADSTLSVQGPATLSVDGTVNLHDNTVLDIGAGPNSPALHAERVILGDNVAFTLGGISHEDQLDKVLVSTSHGIQGDFASFQVGGFKGTVDYLNLNIHKSTDQTQLLASYGLSWTTNNNLAHGTFTLSGASDRFVVGTALKDQNPNSATGWNGSTLHKAGAGTLVLSGQNSYTGGTTLAGGRLQVSQDANLGAASGELRFEGGTLVTTDSFNSARDITMLDDGRIQVDADTTLSLTGAIVGQADLIKSGAGSLRLTNEANAYLNSRIEEGRLIGQAATIPGNVENNGTLIFDQASDDTYAGGISGTGSLVKDGSGTLRLTGDNSAFSGDTTLVAGRLVLNGKLGGSSTIRAGSVLGGSGVIGSGAGSSVTVTDGGTLSPGNSIGTLTINGDLHVQPGARLIVETEPQSTSADLINVTGKTSLSGGSVAHIGANGNYDLRSSYTILASEGALSGEFGDVTSDFAFLRPSLSYDYQNGKVTLVLERNDHVMASAAQTRNQSASANAIESIGLHASHAVYDAIAQLPNDPDLLRASFDGLSGELHASVKTVLQEDSRQIRDTVNERLRSASRAVAAQAPHVRNDQGQLAAADSTGTHSWIQGMGSWRSADATDNTARVSSSSSGFLIGVDTLVSDSARVGLLAGYSRSDIKLRDRSSSARSDNYHLGAYGGTQWGALGLRGGLAYSWHDLSTRRSVSVPRVSDTLKADYSSQSTQAFAELGYRIDTAAVALEPFAQLAYVHQQTDSFTEKGGAAALHAKRQTTNTTFMTLGTRAMTEFELGRTQANVHGSLAWRHAMGTVKPSATHAFSAGSAFTVVGAPIAKNSAMLEAGVELKINPQAAIGLAYQGQLARSAQDHSMQARLNIRF